MVFSHEVEQQLLAGLLNHPQKYVEVAPFHYGPRLCL